MLEDETKYSLADRPKWWLPKLMKWFVIISVILAFFMWVVSTIIYSFNDSYESEEEGDEASELASTIGDVAYEVMSNTIDILFFVCTLWILSLAVDKLDQLVWLNASDEDKEFLIEKRKRKNAKNQ